MRWDKSGTFRNLPDKRSDLAMPQGRTFGASVRSQRTISVRPAPDQLQVIQQFADNHECSLGTAVLRLAMAGAKHPESVELSPRAELMRQWCRDEGLGVREAVSRATKEWGITGVQARALLQESRAQQTDQLLADSIQVLHDALDARAAQSSNDEGTTKLKQQLQSLVSEAPLDGLRRADGYRSK